MNEVEFTNDSESGSDAVTILSASEALELIRKGTKIENARIDRLKLSGNFAQPIELINVTLVQPRFSAARFEQEVRINGSKILRPRFERQTTFDQGLNLGGTLINRGQLRNIEVRGTLRCDNVTFQGNLRVESCRFQDSVRFWEAEFEGWTTFTNCSFGGIVDMRSFNAAEGFQLSKCQCNDDVLFRGSSIAKKFDLGGSRFEKLLDLSKAKLHDFVYLEDIEQGDNQRFRVENAIGDHILIAPEQLEGRLQSELDGDFQSAMREFGFFKRNYEALHRYESEDWAIYRFKTSQRREKRRSWWRPWEPISHLLEYLFLDIGCGYGTNPFRAVATAIVIMVIFALIYAGGIHYFSIDRPPIPTQASDSLSNSLLFGLMTSVSVFTAGFTGDHLTSAHGWVLVPLGAEALLGTLLWGLFIVAFSRKVIR